MSRRNSKGRKGTLKAKCRMWSENSEELHVVRM